MEYLTRKQLIFILLGLFAFFATCQVVFFAIPNSTSSESENGETSPDSLASPASPTSSPKPTATPKPKKQHELVEEFGCQWILDTYRPMAELGRDFAVLHLSNEMTLKRNSAFGYIGTGDAAEALRECER